MSIPWYGWIATVGVVVWAAVAIIGTLGYALRRRGGAGAKDAAQANTASSQAVLAKLESIDARLSVIEKTLTDIH